MRIQFSFEMASLSPYHLSVSCTKSVGRNALNWWWNLQVSFPPCRSFFFLAYSKWKLNYLFYPNSLSSAYFPCIPATKISIFHHTIRLHLLLTFGNQIIYDMVSKFKNTHILYNRSTNFSPYHLLSWYQNSIYKDTLNKELLWEHIQLRHWWILLYLSGSGTELTSIVVFV